MHLFFCQEKFFDNKVERVYLKEGGSPFLFMNKEKLIIILTVLVDVLGVGVIIPTLPFYVQRFGASPLQITALLAVFSFFSFLSSPILGSLSDKIGRKPVLVASIASTAAGWMIFASAKNIYGLFLGRIIDGLAAGNYSTAQSCMADLTKDEKERTANLGQLGALFGLGFIIGPMIGGLLSQISPNAPFWFSGILAALNAILAIFFLPETNRHLVKDKKLNLNPFRPIFLAMAQKEILHLFVSLFLFNLGIAASQATFALYASSVFSINAAQVGLIMSGMGVLMSLNQGLLLKNFWLPKFKEGDLELYGVIFLGISFIIAGVPMMWLFLLSILIRVFAQSVSGTVLSSEIAAAAKPSNRGEIMGAASAVGSLATILAPILAGVFFGFYAPLPFYFSALCCVGIVAIVWTQRKKFQELSEPQGDISTPSNV